MNEPFSDRIRDVPRSFIREILKDALQPDTISFAGGLPNADLFPVDALQQATDLAFQKYGKQLFQYSASEGFLPLRQWIVERYQQKGLDIDVNHVLITSGSQQGLDILGKVVLNEGDALAIEEPGYLGAIQAFSLFRPSFCPVPVDEQGMDCNALAQTLDQDKPKLIYTVPNFQNPSGITYPTVNRSAVAELIQNSNSLLIEDNPYGELRFAGQDEQSFYQFLPDQCVLLGSFSKTIVPGFRLGWIVAPEHMIEKLIIAKQATDLHTNQLAQCIVFEYIQSNLIDEHIKTIIDVYREQKDAMVAAMKQYFPSTVTFTRPEGGMFLWADTHAKTSAVDVFHRAAKEKVLFVPGDPFYCSSSMSKRKKTTSMRLNFTCVDAAAIKEGIRRLGNILHEYS